MQIKVDRELDKAARFLRDRIEPNIHKTVLTIQALQVVNIGEPEDYQHFITRAEQGNVAWKPAILGEKWGTTWGTTWFLLQGDVDLTVLNRSEKSSGNSSVANSEDSSGHSAFNCSEKEGRPLELVVDLGWTQEFVGGQCEAMVYRADGSAVKALHPLNNWVRLSGEGAAGNLINENGHFRLYMEAVNNPRLVHLPARSTQLGEGPTGRSELGYLLKRIDVCVFDEELWNYAIDVDTVANLIKALPPASVRYWKLARALQTSLNVFDDDNLEKTVKPARQALAQVLSQPAYASTLHEYAIGHAHIDCAYLWPVRETKRKVARTVANVLALMDLDSQFTFAMSSAQQYEWLEKEHPDLFNRMLERIQQGRFIPVGGMWVEADGMLPSGESLIRQISMGKRYFKQHLGVEPHGVWLPDSFGYCGAWPQIARKAGYSWFLTQKISWNDTTRFPHHSFEWQGLDGTRILTHFPPTDTYAAEVRIPELKYAEENFKDKAISDVSLLLYGYGDGGGGPTRQMRARARRMHNLEGVPSVQDSNVADFFAEEASQLQAAPQAERPVWQGELYLQLHRKTLTSQQKMKEGNRREESLLRTAEYLCTLASLMDPDYQYPYDQFTEIWKRLLLNQFHDTLSGSAISWAHREAREIYEHDQRELEEMITHAQKSLEKKASAAQLRDAVISPNTWTAMPSIDRFAPEHISCVDPVSVEEMQGYIRISNGLVTVQVTDEGKIVSLHDAHGKEYIPQGHALGEYQLLMDKPSRYDAWEIERDSFLTSHPACHDVRVSLLEKQSGQKGVLIKAQLGEHSCVETTVSLTPGSMALHFDTRVNWKETDRMLKVAIPAAIQAQYATYEAQYGVIRRPIVKNTAEQEATFESCTHRFIHVGEGRNSLSVVNSSTYGASVFTLGSEQLGAYSPGVEIGLSLLSSSTYPDPHADKGEHHFTWLVAPSAELSDSVRLANELNAPVLPQMSSVPPLVSVEQIEGHVQLDWVKLADDRSGDIIVRVYETVGQPALARLHVSSVLDGWSVRETQIDEEKPLDPSLRPAVRGCCDLEHDDSRMQQEETGKSQKVDNVLLDLTGCQFATLRLSRTE